MLRLAGSLKLGRAPAIGIMRMLQVGDRPTRLAQALAEFGRVEKTLHMQYLRQKLRSFCMNPADFRSLENPLVD